MRRQLRRSRLGGGGGAKCSVKCVNRGGSLNRGAGLGLRADARLAARARLCAVQCAYRAGPGGEYTHQDAGKRPAWSSQHGDIVTIACLLRARAGPEIHIDNDIVQTIDANKGHIINLSLSQHRFAHTASGCWVGGCGEASCLAD